MSEKILIIGAFPPKKSNVYGGVLKSCQILINSKIFEDFNILTLDSTQKTNPAPNLGIRIFYALKRTLSLIKILLLERPKITLIFTSDGFSAIEKGVHILICKCFNSKTLIFPRAGRLINQVSRSKVFLRIIQILFNKADIFLCQGKKWKEFAVNDLKINNSKTKVLGNWTATESLLRIGENRNYTDTKINFIFIGWIEDHKGVFELLETSKNLLQENIDFNLTFIGRGKAEFAAKEFIKTHNMTNVNFLGWRNSDELSTILEKHDVFVLPSWNEGMPNSMIESMAAGLAVIVTSVGVITDYLDNNENAIIIAKKDIASLKEAMIKVIMDFNFRVKLSRNGQSLVKNNFSTNKELSELRSIINNLINNEK